MNARSAPDSPAVVLRSEVLPTDREAVRRVVASTGFFRQDEVDIAVELVDERLARGAASGYEFLFAENAQSSAEGESRVLAYACYGEIPCTVASYDLYWIAADVAAQGRGLGGMLLTACEADIRRRGGRHLYIETSGKPQYVPTRGFYERFGFSIATELQDFYDVNDAKVIFRKVLK